MNGNSLSFVIPWLIAFGGIGAVLEVCVNGPARKALRERIAGAWLKLAEMDAEVVARSPLLLANILMSETGRWKLSSLRGFLSIATISFLQLVMTLSVVGMIQGVPFSMNQPPWQTFDGAFDIFDKMLVEVEKPNKSPQQEQEFKTWRATVQSYRTSENRIGYTTMCWGIAIILNAIGYWFALSMSKLILREMLKAEARITFVALTVLVYLIGWLLLVLMVATMIAVTVPATWVLLGVILLVIKGGGFYYGITLAWVYLLGSWFFCPIWIRVCAFTVSMPALILFWMAFTSFFLYPIRKYVHKVTVWVLDNMLQYPKGEILFVTTMLGGLSSLLALIIRK